MSEFTYFVISVVIFIVLNTVSFIYHSYLHYKNPNNEHDYVGEFFNTMFFTAFASGLWVFSVPFAIALVIGYGSWQLLTKIVYPAIENALKEKISV